MVGNPLLTAYAQAARSPYPPRSFVPSLTYAPPPPLPFPSLSLCLSQVCEGNDGKFVPHGKSGIPAADSGEVRQI
jgi:hypothetical protein